MDSTCSLHRSLNFNNNLVDDNLVDDNLVDDNLVNDDTGQRVEP